MADSEDKKRLLSNFFSLSVLQGLNMLLPLVTLPYLVQTLGAENFGLINFVLSIIMYFHILVGFGFDLSATRAISIHKEDKERVSQIFSAVMLLKSLLFIFSFLLLTLLIVSFDIFAKDAALYYVTFGIVLGNLLFPAWLFQGMEDMKYITYINLVTKVIFTILIFVLVKEKSDYIYVPLLNSLGTILGGAYSLWIIPKLFKIRFRPSSKEMIISLFKESFHFFLSRVANNGSRFYATTIIGMTFGNTIVGYYAMVEKLYYAFLSLGGVVSQTIFPYMSRTKNLIFFKKMLFLFSLGALMILTPLIYWHQEFLGLIFSIEDDMLNTLFVLLFSGAIFGILNALMGYPLLAAFGYIKYANNSLIYASILYMVYISITAFLGANIYIVAFSIIVYDFFALMFRVYYVYKVDLFQKKKKD